MTKSRAPKRDPRTSRRRRRAQGHDKPVDFDLAKLHESLPAFSTVRAKAFAEAARVSLHTQGHSSGTLLEVQGDYVVVIRLRFRKPSEKVLRSWRDPNEAAEDGATAIAFVEVLELTDYTVVERSAIGTTVDYWLGFNDRLPFQNAARLEVSGIARGDDSLIRGRVREKIQRLHQSRKSLPALVSVTAFGTPKSTLVNKP